MKQDLQSGDAERHGAGVEGDASSGEDAERSAVGRIVERTIEIPAPPAAVWRALTDAEELARWFPLEARVTLGPGGSIWISWGPPYEGKMRIAIWDPPRRLKTSWYSPDAGEGRGADGDTAKSGSAEAGSAARPHQAVPLAVDYLLEARGGSTVLRLVHSGFGGGAEWDDEYDSVRRGWNFELRGLRHYLAHHAGQPRRVIWARTQVQTSNVESWQRVMGPEGLRLDPTEGLREGDVYVMRPDGLGELRGRVEICEPAAIFCGTVEGLEDALLRVELEKGKTPQLYVWLSTYGVPEETVRELQDGLDAMLRRLFHATGAPEAAVS